MEAKVLIIICFVLIGCINKSDKSRINVKQGSSIDTSTYQYSEKVLKLSLDSIYKIDSSVLYRLERNTFQRLGVIQEFDIRGMVYRVMGKVKYEIKNGVVYKTFNGKNYFHNNLGFIERYKIDKSQRFTDKLEDSIIIKIDLNSSLVMGTNSAMLYWVEDIIRPKNKYDHLVSSYILIKNYSYSGNSIIMGELEYIVQERKGGNYVHYGYSIFQKNTYNDSLIGKEQGIPPQKPTD